MTRRPTEVGVLVTAVGCGTTGEQILRALQAGRRAYRLTATNAEASGLAVAAGVNKILLPPAADPDYIGALAEAARRAGAQFVFPGCDPELRCISDRREELARLSPVVAVMNNRETIRVCLDKQSTTNAISAAGLAAPVSASCSSVAGAVQAVEEGALRYPVVIKPREGPGGSLNVHIAQDEGELRFFVAYVLRMAPDLLLQEYVGSADEEYSASIVHYPDGTYGGSASVRRRLGSPLSTRLRVPNHTSREELGPWLAIASGFSQGTVGVYPEIESQAREVAEQLGSTGPLNIQGRRTTGGRFIVFEINPRFSGTTGLRARVGHNGPEGLIDWHLGEPGSLAPDASYPFVRGLVDYIEGGE
jgi:carbamoyl-phosphate synthase large subunit